MEPVWVWLQEDATADSYGEFCTSFDWEGGETELRISADSDYTLFLNGQFVNSDQYKDFPYCKVYDRLDITPYLHRGVNHMAVVVWHYDLSGFEYPLQTADCVLTVWCTQSLLLLSTLPI